VTVTPIRVTATQLQSRIREAARSSANVIFIPPLEKRSMAGMMTFQQALSCLREGKIVGQPKLNANGDWVLKMERFAGNSLFKLPVIAVCKGTRVAQLIVTIQGA
jgi:hypothetical protein